MKILHLNKSDLERFFQIKDNINLYYDYGDLYLKCVSVSKLLASREVEHLHYIPNREITILRHVYSNDQRQVFLKPRNGKMKGFCLDFED